MPRNGAPIQRGRIVLRLASPLLRTPCMNAQRPPIREWPPEDRPRERFLTKGAEALSDAECLALLLGTLLIVSGGVVLSWERARPEGYRSIGIAWALVVPLYLIAAWALWVDSPRKVGLLVLATVPSLILSTLALWAAVVGVVIDVALLIVAWRLHVVERR